MDETSMPLRAVDSGKVATGASTTPGLQFSDRLSGQDFANDIPVYVGEAKVVALGAVGELGVVKA